MWEERRAILRKLAESIPEGKESFAVAPGVMSLAGHILHVLSAEKTALDALTVTPGKWDFKTEINPENYPRREDVLRVLDEQTVRAREYFDALTEEKMAEMVKLPWNKEYTIEVLWLEWMVHDAHHCGSFLTTMRAAGLKPPNIWG